MVLTAITVLALPLSAHAEDTMSFSVGIRSEADPDITLSVGIEGKEKDIRTIELKGSDIRNAEFGISNVGTYEYLIGLKDAKSSIKEKKVSYDKQFYKLNINVVYDDKGKLKTEYSIVDLNTKEKVENIVFRATGTTPVPQGSTPPTGTPQTGDGSKPLMYSLVATASGAMMLGLMIIRRRKRNE